MWCACVAATGLHPPADIVATNGDLYKDSRLVDDFEGLIDWRVGDKKDNAGRRFQRRRTACDGRPHGEHKMKRLRLGLTDIERRIADERRRLRNNGLAICLLALVAGLLLDWTR